MILFHLPYIKILISDFLHVNFSPCSLHFKNQAWLMIRFTKSVVYVGFFFNKQF